MSHLTNKNNSTSIGAELESQTLNFMYLILTVLASCYGFFQDHLARTRANVGHKKPQKKKRAPIFEYSYKKQLSLPHVTCRQHEIRICIETNF